jgi:translocation and assembly module TamB
VDLRAKRTVPGYVVGVIARGRLRKPQLTLYSDPPLPQTQIASLLLVGQTLDSLQSRDRAALGASRPDLVTQGGGVLAGQLGRYVGLDEVSVQTSADYDASLVLGKFLSPRLYVSYGISLTQAINTFKLRYTIGDRWVLAGEAGEVASADLLFTVER